MLRPRWVLALLLALAVAAGFAWLGQWQLERAVTSGPVTVLTTETPVPLTTLVRPNGPTMQVWDGQRVTVSGYFESQDYEILTNRYNGGEQGFWVVGHFVVLPDATAKDQVVAEQDGVALAVALGWTKDRTEAETAVAGLQRVPRAVVEMAGRYVNTEAPVAPKPGDDPYELTTMSVASLINLWHDFTDMDVYGGYVVDNRPPLAMDAIDSPAPEHAVSLNWLNIFYAAEWAIFAGFAVFLWYRLVKDAWEREQELAELALREPQGP